MARPKQPDPLEALVVGLIILFGLSALISLVIVIFEGTCNLISWISSSPRRGEDRNEEISSRIDAHVQQQQRQHGYVRSIGSSSSSSSASPSFPSSSRTEKLLTESTTPTSSKPPLQNQIIRIVMDATPDRAGGMLILPEDELVYFYSIEWSQSFKFGYGGQDKLELVNSLLALEIFGRYVRTCRCKYNGKIDLLLQVNRLFQIHHHSDQVLYPAPYWCILDYLNFDCCQKNIKWRNLLEEVNLKLESWPFRGRWTIQDRVNTGKIARNLSGINLTNRSRIPTYEVADGHWLLPYADYEHTNVSTAEPWLDDIIVQLKNIGLGELFGEWPPSLRYTLLQSASPAPSRTIFPSNSNTTQQFFPECVGEAQGRYSHLTKPMTTLLWPKNMITIAVDATPERCGGVLVLPKEQLVFYYSIDWTRWFDFERVADLGPDKFEMVNAMIALEIFRNHVKPHRINYGADALVVKTDSNFFGGYVKQKNQKWKNLLDKINEELEAEHFQGVWEQTGRQKDWLIRMADKLSRADHSTSSMLPTIEFQGRQVSSSFYLDYVQKNLSDDDEWLLCVATELVMIKIDELFSDSMIDVVMFLKTLKPVK